MNWKILLKRIAGPMALAALIPALSAASGAGWLDDFDEALKRSAAAGKPVLMDFQAAWCYSCYYMDKHVLASEAFKKASEKMILLKVDVDKPKGLALKLKYKVSFLPSYVVIDSKGKDLGRIIGEQTHKDFMVALKALFKDGDSPEERLIKSLEQKLAAKQYDEAFAELSQTSKETLKKMRGRPDWKVLRERLALRKAAAAKEEKGLKSLRVLLKRDYSCELAYDVYYAEPLVEKLSEKSRREILGLERPVMEKLVRDKIFNPKPYRCADGRTAVQVLEGIYKGLGLEGKRRDLLEQAVGFYGRLAAKTGEDRNLDDNYRYFLHAADKDDELLKLYPRLIAAYPADYVYAYRFARHLSSKGEAGEALRFIKKADRLAYGANRLAVTRVRAKILASLGNKKKAVKILRSDIRWGEKNFPESAAQSRALLEELQASSEQ